MTLEETNNCEIIDELIRQGRSFAMYRNPGEEEPHFLMQTCGEVHLIRKMEDLNGRTGFVIAPFRVTPQCPIILIRPDCHEIPAPETCIPLHRGTMRHRTGNSSEATGHSGRRKPMRLVSMSLSGL